MLKIASLSARTDATAYSRLAPDSRWFFRSPEERRHPWSDI